MFIDAHAHLDKYSDNEIDDIFATIERENIFTLSVSIDVPSFLRIEEIAAGSTRIVPAFGVQPWEAPRYTSSIGDIEQYVARSPFIGEIGLDHRFVTDKSHYGPQRDVFSHFLWLAREQDKLVNVHCVGAEHETVDVMRASGIERAIIHWYSGPLDALGAMIDEGYLFTVGVEVLHSDHIRDVATMIPTDQLLTETDNPGGPEWVTGERGHPGLIVDVVEALAGLRRIPPEEIQATVQANLLRLFVGDEHLAPWFDQLSF